MNIEILEHELAQLHDKTVIIVRPGYGDQSDSWQGILTSLVDFYPIKFHLESIGHSMIFTTNDVFRLDPPTTSDTQKIIRLKGPLNYAEDRAVGPQW